MASVLRNLKHTFAAGAIFAGLVLGLSAPAATADQREQRLFALLQNATGDEAIQIEQELERIWSRSGSPSMDYLLERGNAALAAGDIEAALEHFGALTEQAPDFAAGWNARAFAYYSAGAYGPAIADLAHALSLNPRLFGAMAGLALILDESGEYANALAVYRRLATIHPHRPGLEDAIDRLSLLIGEADL